MAKINVLSKQLINKIAAGEVVERPASVVKEMMENSLDAGATRITVEIEEGGKKLIRVSDNGCGMDQEDILLAFTAHATSKITAEEDLFAIGTLGFRGEALASIASISQIEIVSRPTEAIEGASLEISAGSQSPITPAATSPGTTIAVRNLFFNTPARRKFLRTTNTEMGHITEQFIRIALANTESQLKLVHNGRIIHDLPAGQPLQERIGSLFSTELSDGLFAVQRRDRDIEITGLIAHPRLSRIGSQGQYIFLNGRHIRDRFVGHAVREAYRGMLEINRQPTVFLFLQMPAETVDVNVHPAKTEVRFSNSNAVHSIVLAAVRDRLLGSDLTVAMGGSGLSATTTSNNKPTNVKLPAAESDHDQQEHQQRVRQAMADFFKSVPPPPGSKPQHYQSQHKPGAIPPSTITAGDQTTEEQLTETENLPDITSEHREFPGRPAEQGRPAYTAMDDEKVAQSYVDLGPVLQIHNTYIITQTEEGLLIIDQHALHERILYEKLSGQLNQGPLTGQRSLIPEVVEVTAEQMAMAENQTELLMDLGIILEQFGPRSLAVQSFPMLLEKAGPADFINDLLDLLLEQAGKTTREELIHHVLDMMACKAAVKAGDPLTDSEIKSLLTRSRDIPQAGTCPHGRPTTIRLSLSELEKQFKRT